MIPIKNPNISTNRYKELLRTEKYCDKLQKEYFNYIETSRNRMEELCNEIGDLEERIDKAIEYLESYNIDFKHSKFNESPISIRELGDLLEILQGSDKE